MPDTDLSHRTPPRALVWGARVLLLAYLAVLVVVVLSPSSGVQSDLVLRASQRLVSLGAPPRFATYDRVEMLANVAMVVPVGFLGVLSWSRTRWQSWTAFAFLGSLTVELFQGFVLPAREAAPSDVVANTLGVLVGALIAYLLVRLIRGAGRR